jgi:hypothetical protein
LAAAVGEVLHNSSGSEFLYQLFKKEIFAQKLSPTLIWELKI